jgi:integral membrane sensor domain MASE1
VQDKTRLTTLTRVVALTALYFLGGLLGKESSFLSGSVALVWPPSGIALAAILLYGYRFWPGIAIGAVLFSTIDGVPLGFFTLGTAVATRSARLSAFFYSSDSCFFRMTWDAHAMRQVA